MIDDTRLLDKRLALGIVAACLLIAVMIAVQLVVGVITMSFYPVVIYFGFISNLLVLPGLLYLATKHSAMKLPALTWLHVSMGLMIVYFSQTYSPFTATWAILILIAAQYFSWKGFLASSFSLVVMGTSYIILQPKAIHGYGFVNYCFLSALIVVLTIFMAYIFFRITKNGQNKNRQLQRAQQSEQLQVNRLNTLLNSISDAVVTLNRYGRVTSQNAAAQAFFDTNESLIGRNIDQLLELTDLENKRVSIRDLISEIKSSSMRDDLSVGKDADVRHLSIQMSRIRGTFGDEEEYGIVLIIRDITKQKTLEDEKDEFISVTSHELRTPVAIAEGSLSNFLLMQERDLPKEKLRQAADEAHTQVVYLSKMINDLSTLSRAERGVGDVVEPIDINELIHNLYTKYTPEAEAKSLKLNLDADTNLPQIETSRLYLEEILQNFITNAIKYTKEGSVTLGAKMESDSHVRFFVKDTGIGISKSDLEHVFDKFYRSEDYRTRETSGTGLGLYVVHKLADKLDTHVSVESRLNSGSTFSFVLALKTNRLAMANKPVKPAGQKPQQEAEAESRVEPELAEAK